jgi:hypothetical protein
MSPSIINFCLFSLVAPYPESPELARSTFETRTFSNRPSINTNFKSLSPGQVYDLILGLIA